MSKKTPLPEACKRPYTLGKRQIASDERRGKVLAAARELVESKGFLNLSLEGVARQASVTRQTVYNLFGTRTQLIEALFDQLASQGGMHRIREVMQQQDAEIMLPQLIEIFVRYWGSCRLLTRRIHGLAAIDPEFENVMRGRSKRRRALFSKIVDRVVQKKKRISAKERTRRIALLHTVTSFAFFDGLSEGVRPAEEVLPWIVRLAREALDLPLES